MNITQVKDALFKQATIFQTGGLQPTEELGKSWIGKVLWGTEGETIPSNFDPICTIFINKLPYVPKELISYQLLTIYMDFDVFNNLNMDNLVSFFKIICYTNIDELHKINEQSTKIIPFPLTPLFIDNDTPAWEDSNSIAPEIEDEISRLESEEGMEYYEDIVEKIYSTHKVGGYPSFTQSGVYFGEDYPFVFQISSDEKAQFNIVESGSFYFFYNQEKQDWIVYCDFY
ncbi:DUF1963 domain-containing protein [Cytobacillus purgationiresistens]|uniref:DUF1963 domain-containing protein n=1 Tax=Cytobacillus purgationiresistens TaxID=863449 RepID=A0ABU0AKB6_9BACI|nr:DUF1963 domain-containing protein [Cytobacillus purgationiresistens]MDQ0271719.1 hypothetical protein [Cytobacillus purgationiresistens]